ncbi:MAG: 6-carboxytetrahydropterin synthase QueD [Veillonellales bacterium]
MKEKVRAKKIFTFDAAHSLPGYDGKCANIHGHTYRLEVVVSRPNGGLAEGGSSDGMVIDFSELSRIVKTEIIDQVDHKWLNDVFAFRTTSENMAVHFFQLLARRLQDSDVVVEKVLLWETPTSCIEVGK